MFIDLRATRRRRSVRSATSLDSITLSPWRGESPLSLRSINMQLLTELGILDRVRVVLRSRSSVSLPATRIELSNTTYFKSDFPW
jgi:hypothetical protein